MAECEARARAAGAQVIQLTTDKTRLRAHAFYDRLGYTPSHIGYKKAALASSSARKNILGGWVWRCQSPRGAGSPLFPGSPRALHP